MPNGNDVLDYFRPLATGEFVTCLFFCLQLLLGSPASCGELRRCTTSTIRQRESPQQHHQKATCNYRKASARKKVLSPQFQCIETVQPLTVC